MAVNARPRVNARAAFTSESQPVASYFAGSVATSISCRTWVRARAPRCPPHSARAGRLLAQESPPAHDRDQDVNPEPRRAPTLEATYELG